MKTPLTNYLLTVLGLGLLASIGFSIAPTSHDSPATDYDARIVELGIKLPEPSASVGIFKKAVVSGNMIYLSGHICISEEGEILKGKVGDNVEVDAAAAAAYRSGIGMLASLKNELGTLNRIKRLVKTTGMVNCTSDFTQQPEVINGCSQLFVDVFGEENGKGARAAVGMSSLPRGSIVEIEAIFELVE